MPFTPEQILAKWLQREPKVLRYAKRHDANYEFGQFRKVKKGRESIYLFYLTKEGADPREVTWDMVCKGTVNPWLRPTKAEYDQRVQVHAKRLEAQYRGEDNGKKGNQLKFKLYKDGREAWPTLGQLDRGIDPFSRCYASRDRAHLESRVLELIKPHRGVAYTGYMQTEKGSAPKFELTCRVNKKRLVRWRSIAQLETGVHPFARAQQEETYLEMVEVGKKWGATPCPEPELNEAGFWCYRFKMKGRDDRLCIAGNARRAKNPFLVLTKNERIAEAKTHEKRLKAKLIGYDDSGRDPKLIFQQKERIRSITLAHLRAGNDPFSYYTTAENEIFVRQECARRGWVYHEIYEYSPSGKTTLFVISYPPNFAPKKVAIGNLRQGKNPFIRGFNPEVVAFIYLVLIKGIDGVLYGFGVTNRWIGRLNEHIVNLNKENLRIVRCWIWRFALGYDALDFETWMKRMVVQQQWKPALMVIGFYRESFMNSKIPLGFFRKWVRERGGVPMPKIRWRHLYTKHPSPA